MRPNTGKTSTAKTILLGRTTHPDWPSLVQAVLSHVQQAAHEAPSVWLRSQSQRRVRLEMAPELADIHHIKSQIRGVTQALGTRLAKDLAVRSFVVVKGCEVQKHRLVLSGF
jgi:hypothetical protein